MADSQRIDDLRRRVQKDPASIAFAQLAEELRRAGRFPEAVDTCRVGLAMHPAYLSARVTLGRSLMELACLDEARMEFELVLRSASDNLAAIRGVAEILHRQGGIEEALDRYRAALDMAPNDPDLEAAVAGLEAEVAAMHRAVAEAALTAEVEDVSCIPEPVDPAREQALRTVAALEHWLDAINVACPDRRA